MNVTVERTTQASSKIADQLVTVLATLLTAVVSFYFATSSIKEITVPKDTRQPNEANETNETSETNET